MDDPGGLEEETVVDLKQLSLGERVLAATSLFLWLDLMFLPWHRIIISIPGATRVTESTSGIQAPNAFLGLLALVLVAGLLAQVILSNLTSVRLPEIPMSWGRADLLAAGGVAGLLVLKLVLETSFLGIGAWLALAAAAGLVLGAFLYNQELTEPRPA
jgi:hypothetical protein